ncbi:response regulator [Candidatus Nitrospira allomarina]|uniref:Response regulator n=1 Tax=Candidatus Nitrospira allomarina TaxID=3020900 RepID=A0AA96JXM7_9BACT|nr:response regulator [Candidatus Nitrospira allomarina]WNM59176.1 response regulator [Candidatus Nitrospira allomarina]
MKKILLVDDNETNMYLARFILQQHGHEVIEARNGAQAVELAIKEKLDMIIMDIQLPDLNGLEATKRIRASEVGSKIPIIAFTSYAMPGDRERSLAAGCTGYIEKPLNPDTFMAELGKHM